MAAGGGVPGKAAGTALIIMTEGGVITEAYRLFTEMFLPAGEMISGIADGKGIRGNISGYLIRTFNATGADGKETGTGKGRTPGVSRDCLPEAKEMSILRDLKAILALVVLAMAAPAPGKLSSVTNNNS